MPGGASHHGTAKILALAVCLPTAAALIAGCGQNKKSRGAAEHPLNKTEFVGVANAICAPVNKAIAAGAKLTLGSGKPTPQQVDQFATRYVVPQINAEIKKLRSLPAPIGDMNIVKTIYDEMQRATDKVRADPQLLGGGGPNPYAQPDQLAKGYGLTVCASAPVG